MKKLSVVLLTTLVLLSAQGLEAKNITANNDQVPEAVLFSLVQKYRGYTLISSRRVGKDQTESYRAVIIRNGILKEVALSPYGGVRGEIYLDGTAENYRDGQGEIHLDKAFRKSLIEQGFNKKIYRRNVDHQYENRNDRYAYRYGYPYYRYSYRYFPRYYRIYRY